MTSHPRLLRQALEFFAAAILIVGSLVIAWWAIRSAYRWEYWREYNEVRAELQRIPHIRVLRLWGNEDLTLEDIYAVIELDGKRTLHLSNLTKEAFQGKRRFWLDEIGGWTFSMQKYGHHGAYNARGRPSKGWAFGYSIDVGPDGEFSDVLGIRLHSVQDVIGQYDRILAALASWPTCPAEAKMTGRNGDEIRYAKRRRDAANCPYADPILKKPEANARSSGRLS